MRSIIQYLRVIQKPYNNYINHQSHYYKMKSSSPAPRIRILSASSIQYSPSLTSSQIRQNYINCNEIQYMNPENKKDFELQNQNSPIYFQRKEHQLSQQIKNLIETKESNEKIYKNRILQLQNLLKENNKIIIQKTDKNEIIQKLNKQIHQLKKENSNFEQKVNILNFQIQNNNRVYQKNNQKYQIQIQALQKQLNQMIRITKILEVTNLETKQQLIDLQQEYNKIEEQYEQYRRNKYHASEQEFVNKSNQLNQYEDLIRKLQNMNSELIKQIQKLEQNNNRYGSEIEILTRQNKTKNEQILQMNYKHKKIELQLNEKYYELERKYQALKSTSGKWIQKLLIDLDTLQMSNSELRRLKINQYYSSQQDEIIEIPHLKYSNAKTTRSFDLSPLQLESDSKFLKKESGSTFGSLSHRQYIRNQQRFQTS